MVFLFAARVLFLDSNLGWLSWLSAPGSALYEIKGNLPRLFLDRLRGAAAGGEYVSQ